MKLKTRMLTAQIISMLFAVSVIGFILFQLSLVESTQKQTYQKLVEMESINSEFIQYKQLLLNYSLNASEAVKKEIVEDQTFLLNKINEKMDETEDKDVLDALQLLQTKLQKQTDTLTTAFATNDVNTVKREELRTLGMMNVMYEVKYKAQQHAEQTDIELAKEIKGTEQIAIAGIIILVVGITLTTLIQIRKIVHPIGDIVKKAQAVADGKLDVEIHDTNRKDEIGDLTKAFGIMVSNLRSMLISVNSTKDDVELKTSEMKKYNEKMVDITSQVTESTTDMAKGVQLVSHDLQDTVEKIDSLQNSFTLNLEKAENARGLTEKTVSTIQEGKDAINTQQGWVKQNLQNTEQMNKKIKEFAEVIQEVESISKAVAQLSEQTGLLSLNASIEAARAGEHGKGFMVVAEEVKKLSNQSGEATKEIFALVNSVSEGIEDILKRTEENSHSVYKQEENMQSTIEKFETIGEKVQEIEETLKELAGELRESLGESNKILKITESISTVTIENNAGIEEISATADEQLNYAEKMMDRMNQLQHSVKELNEEFTKFKL